MKKLLAMLLVLAMAATMSVTASAAINDGLYDYWTFDEDGNSLTDMNNFELKREDQIGTEGAPCGTGYLQMGGLRDVLGLVGMDAYGPYFDTDEMTIAFWVKLDTTKEEGIHTILGFGTGGNYDYLRLCITAGSGSVWTYFQSTNSNYGISGYLPTETNADGTEQEPERRYNIVDGEWHHIAFTAKLDYAPIYYIDGVAYETDTEITEFIGDSTGYFVIGAMNDMIVDLFKGGLDDLRIYTRYLEEEEVAELYAMKGTTPDPTIPTTEETEEDTEDTTEETEEDTEDTEDAGDNTTKGDDNKGDNTTKAPTTTDEEPKNDWIIYVAIAAVVVVVVVVVIVVASKKKKA